MIKEKNVEEAIQEVNLAYSVMGEEEMCQCGSLLSSCYCPVCCSLR